MKMLQRFWRDECGIESAEWALLLGIIVLAAVVAATGAKQSMENIFGELATQLADAEP